MRMGANARRHAVQEAQVFLRMQRMAVRRKRRSEIRRGRRSSSKWIWETFILSLWPQSGRVRLRDDLKTVNIIKHFRPRTL